MEGLSARLAQAESKLVDFGNACWTHKQFTQDIQTRQYRCPEACPSPHDLYPPHSMPWPSQLPTVNAMLGFNAGCMGGPCDCNVSEPCQAVLLKQAGMWR